VNRRVFRRRALTMLEAIMATTLLATVVTAVALLLRSGHTAWRAHEEDAIGLESAHATLRHLARNLRQAQSVSAISAANNNNGTLSLVMPSAQTLAWAHNSATNQVMFGVGSADTLLAEGITELSFTGYRGDGVTPTAVIADIRSVLCRARVVLPRDVSGTRDVTCWVWLRSW
jgi:hypothetical protein